VLLLELLLSLSSDERAAAAAARDRWRVAESAAAALLELVSRVAARRRGRRCCCSAAGATCQVEEEGWQRAAKRRHCWTRGPDKRRRRRLSWACGSLSRGWQALAGRLQLTRRSLSNQEELYWEGRGSAAREGEGSPSRCCGSASESLREEFREHEEEQAELRPAGQVLREELPKEEQGGARERAR
jgi:hypothetical protein